MIAYWLLDRGNYRVWLDSWPDGTFEVLSTEEFNTMEKVFKQFSIPVIEHQEDD